MKKILLDQIDFENYKELTKYFSFSYINLDTDIYIEKNFLSSVSAKGLLNLLRYHSAIHKYAYYHNKDNNHLPSQKTKALLVKSIMGKIYNDDFFNEFMQALRIFPKEDLYQFGSLLDDERLVHLIRTKGRDGSEMIDAIIKANQLHPFSSETQTRAKDFIKNIKDNKELQRLIETDPDILKTLVNTVDTERQLDNRGYKNQCLTTRLTLAEYAILFSDNQSFSSTVLPFCFSLKTFGYKSFQ